MKSKQKRKIARKGSVKYKIGTFVYFLENEYFGLEKGGVYKVSEYDGWNGPLAVNGNPKILALVLIDESQVRKATKIDIITAKLLGKYFE